MHLTCPHCQSPIELVNLPGTGEVLCGSCGSTFRVESGSTVPWDSTAGRRTLGRFELISVVGTGAFGTVYRARDPLLDRVVALKVPRAGNLPEGADLDRFVREGRSAGQLRHPSIVAVHEVGQVEGIPFIVSDFIEGVTLADRMTAGRPSPRESATIIASVAEALGEAHRQGVIHRDIKPSNIMIRPDGMPMVTDFGLAKREAGEVTMTLEGQILGTPAFMSPEQARGDAHQVDGRSDVYSLGAVLYLLLTGVLPFRGNARMLLHQVLNDNPRPPRSLDRSIPRDLETICLKAMAKDPARRYPSAPDLADDLHRWLADRPVLARPVGPVARLALWCRRNPALATESGIALVALAVAIAVSTLYFIGKSRAVERLAIADAGRISALKEADRQKAVAALERGRAEYRDDQAGRGLLHAVEGLRLARLSGDPDLERGARALISTYRNETHSLQNILIGSEPVEGQRAGRVALTRDGKFALVASLNGTARLFDVGSGRSIGPTLTFGAAGAKPSQVAISADGKTAAIAVVRTERLADVSPKMSTRTLSKVSIWDLTSGKLLSEPATEKPEVPYGQERSIAALDFSPDGKILATGTTDNHFQFARRWETATGIEVGSPLEHPTPDVMTAMRFSPDGRMLAVGGWNFISLWDLASERMVGGQAMAFKQTSSLAFRTDGSAVIAAGAKEEVLIWEFPSGSRISVISDLPTRDGPTTAVAISPDGRRLLTGSESGVVRLDEISTGRTLGVLMVQTSPIQTLAFADGGQSVVCATVDGTVRTWKVAEGYYPGSLWELETPSYGLAFGTDGRSLAVASGNRLQFLDPATGSLLGPTRRHGSMIKGMAVSPDGSQILTLTANWTTSPLNGEIKQLPSQVFRDTMLGPPATTPLIEEKFGDFWSAMYTQGGRTILLKIGGFVRLHDAETGRFLGEPWKRKEAAYANLSAAFWATAVDPAGRIALTSPAMGEGAQFWDFTTSPPTPLGPYLKHPDSVTALALDPSGAKGATGCRNGVARLWDTSTRKPIGAEMKHALPVTLLIFSPDGKTLLTGCSDKFGESGEARLWDAASGQPLTPPFKPAHGVSAGAFRPDGRAVAIGDGKSEGKGTISIWNVPVPTDENVETLQLQTQVETGLELSETGEIRELKPETWLERKGRLR